MPIRCCSKRSGCLLQTQGRNQLGAPGGTKSFLRGAQISWTMSNSFKRCSTHFSREAKNFRGGGFDPPSYGPVQTFSKQASCIILWPIPSVVTVFLLNLNTLKLLSPCCCSTVHIIHACLVIIITRTLNVLQLSLTACRVSFRQE